MKTTLDLADKTIESFELVAAKTGRSISEVADDAIRRALPAVNKPSGQGPFKLAVSKHPLVLKPGVDIDNSVALYDLMDSTDGHARR